MRPVTFVAGSHAGKRIVDTSNRGARLDPSVAAKAFGARRVGSSKGMDVFALRAAMEHLLRSSGGRPGP